MTEHPTQYSNTDFVLKSASPIGLFANELRDTCCVLYCTEGDDGNWHMTVEADHDENTCDREAALDIPAMLNAIANLSADAKLQFDACFFRDFNIGIECWDSWSYNHAIPHDVLRAISDAGCSLSFTLYPMRRPDGTPRTSQDGE